MKSLLNALHKAQGEVKNLGKTADNPFFKSKYVPLNEVYDYLRPIMTSNNLGVLFSLSENALHETTCETYLFHTSGESRTWTTKALVSKGTPADLMSFFSYYKRYQLMSIFGIASEDDDGNSATLLAIQDEIEKLLFTSQDNDLKIKVRAAMNNKKGDLKGLTDILDRLKQQLNK